MAANAEDVNRIWQWTPDDWFEIEAPEDFFDDGPGLSVYTDALSVPQDSPLLLAQVHKTRGYYQVHMMHDDASYFSFYVPKHYWPDFALEYLPKLIRAAAAHDNIYTQQAISRSLRALKDTVALFVRQKYGVSIDEDDA